MNMKGTTRLVPSGAEPSGLDGQRFGRAKNGFKRQAAKNFKRYFKAKAANFLI